MAVQGWQGHLGVGKASSGSDLSFAAVARDRFNRFSRCDFKEQHRETPDDKNSGAREVEDVALGHFDARLEAELEGSVEGALTYLLRSLMGTVVSAQQSATPAYLHTFTAAPTLAAADRLTFEKRYGTKAEAEIANGVVNKYRYDFTQPGFVRHQVNALLANPAYSSSPTSPTFPAVGTTRISQPMHTVSLAGVSRKVRGGWVEVDGGNDENDFSATQRGRIDAERGRLKGAFQLEMYFADLADKRRFWDSASATGPGNVAVFYECNVKGEHPTDIAGAATHKPSIEFDMDKVFLREVGTPVQGDGPIIQTVQGLTAKDPTNGAVTIKVKNSQATA
jgi:hypothetical protein